MSEGGCSEIYTAEWINGSYDEWDSEEQQFKRFREQYVVLKRSENVENANQSWFEEAKSHLNISNKWGEIVQCYGLTKDPSNGSYMLSKSNESLIRSQENNSLEINSNIDSLKNYTNSTSKVYHFENLPEPRNATEEELEAFHSKSYNFYIPDNIDDFDKLNNQKNRTSRISSIFKVNSKKLFKIFKKNSKNDVQNSNYYREEIMQQQRKNIDIDEDEVHNNPNLHSEEQDELEIPDNI
ncbi:kinase-like domain-containing protein [Rhizophagus irregularis DAOM 181602=DAOM 197198]|nr:kinase-like domain-containing protein [Rhizophagus irregularis DAOM 181602=DAOM 197198]